MRLRRRSAGASAAVALVCAALAAALSSASPAATPSFASASSAATTAAASTLTIARPAGAGQGHVLVAAVAVRLETAIAPPPGWTEVLQTSCENSGTAVTQALFVRVAAAAEPDAYAFTPGAAAGGAGTIVAYAGVDLAEPVVASGGQVSRNSRSMIAPSLTTTAPQTLLVAAFAHTGTSATATPAPMVARGGATGTPATRQLVADELRGAVGPTGERATQADARNACGVGQLVALRPAPERPASTAPPVVSGVAQEGSTLHAGTGSWANAPTSFAYAWQGSADGGATWTDLAGAAADRVLTGADVGLALRVVVTASNAGGSASAASASTPPVLPAPPASASPPTLAGAPVENETLLADPGAWTGAPTLYAYRWQRSAGGQTWTDVPDAAGATYLLTGADVGLGVRVLVTATNEGGSGAAPSAATGPIAPAGPPTPPAVVDPPTVAGTPRLGVALTATTGAWTGWPRSYAYLWRRSADGQTWEDIAGARIAAYVPVEADVGARLSVTVTATNPAGSGTASSAATAPVLAAPPPPPVGTAAPVVTGDLVEAATLLVTTGEWSGPVADYAYQWQRCSGGVCVPINWATDPGYVLKDDDVGFTVRAVVTASNLGGSASSVSAETALVLPLPPVAEELPQVAGVAAQGERLVASPGDWASAASTTFAYAWQRSSDAGETWTDVGVSASSYVLAAGDVGAVFRVAVTASNAGGLTSAVSAPTAAVGPPGPPASVVAPTLSGQVQDRGRLNAIPGTWSGSPTYTYIWQRSNDGGATWSAVPRARTSRYTPVAADVGRLLRTVVTARNSLGSTTAPSAAALIHPAGNRAIMLNATWFCNASVQLDLVKVTITDNVFRDAAIFDNCSGRIARVEIETNGSDGLKVRNTSPVAHGLTIEGGYVRCDGRAEGAHQDGIQVMGGSGLTFRNLVIWCGDPAGGSGGGVNAAAFISRGGAGASTPTDVVVEHSVMGVDSANGVLVEDSVRSGIRDSIVCPDWTPAGGAIFIGAAAVDGIDSGNEQVPRDDPRCASFDAAVAWVSAAPAGAGADPQRRSQGV